MEGKEADLIIAHHSSIPLFQYSNLTCFGFISTQTNSHLRREKSMITFRYLFLPGALLFQVGVAGAQQYPIMDKLADRVVQKYQSSSCQDLIQKKSQPQTGKREMVEEKALAMLRKDPQMRTEFLNRVAGPIANKMFECGMIP